MTVPEHNPQRDTAAEAALAAVKENLLAWHGAMLKPHELALLQIEGVINRFAKADLGDVTRDMGVLRLLANNLLSQEEASSPLLHTQRLCERIAFCRALHAAWPALFAEEMQAPSVQNDIEDAHAVAILNSPIFSTAITRFSVVLPDAKPLLCQSFTDICEEIAAGNAAFGILPLEDSVEGKLFRLYEQIEHFELHIACTADIPLQEDGKTVRAALLYKSKPPAIKPQGSRTLECLLYEENEFSLSDLLMVAGVLGLSLRRIDSLPISYREDGFAKHLVLCADGDRVGQLAAYLALFMPRTVITADYINI